MKKYKLALLGCGYLNEIVAKALEDGHLPDYELVGVLGRTPKHAEAFTKRYGCVSCQTIEELLSLKPDYIAEAASVQAVKDYTINILESGTSLVVLSIGAFADEAFYAQVQETARDAGQKVYIASGAVGSFDALRTACLMSPVSMSISSRKSVNSLRHSPLYKENIEYSSSPTTMFEGTTKEIIALLPTHMNVAVATALASVGPANTQIKVTAETDFVGDEYVITAQGEEVRSDLKIYSKTSKIAAWSVVSTLRNIASPIVF